MRTRVLACALGLLASVAHAQRPGAPPNVPKSALLDARNGAPSTALAADSARDSLRLTRSDAIAMTLAHNPQLEAAREVTQQVRARRVQSIAFPDPLLVASRDDQSRFLGAPGAKNLGLGLQIPFPDKFRLRNDAAKADVQSSDLQYRLARQQLASAAARSYDSLLAVRQTRQNLLENRQLAQEFATRAEARYQAGTAAKLDAIRARVDVAQADNALIANERDVVNAEAALDRLLGRALGTPIATADSLIIPEPVPPLEELEPRAMSLRPELADLVAQRRGARAASGLAKEFWLPDITISANRDYLQPGGFLFSTGLAVPFPALFWQHTRGEVAESRSRERELEATYRDTRAAVGQDVRTAYAAAVTSLRQVVFLRDELLPAAREAYRIASVGYGLGGFSALDVLDARRSLLDAQNQYTDALAAASSARSDLERAIGAPLDSRRTGDSRE